MFPSLHPSRTNALSLLPSHATFSPFSPSTFLPSSACSFFSLARLLSQTFHFSLSLARLVSVTCLPASHPRLLQRKQNITNLLPAWLGCFDSVTVSFSHFYLYLLYKVQANCFVRVQVQVQVPRHYKMRQQKPCKSRQYIVNTLKYMIE